MKFTFYGHAALQIEAAGKTFLMDPFFTGNSLVEGKISPDTLNPDIILLTHAHGDHYGDTPSILKRTGALLISNYDICMYVLAKEGHENFHPMNTGGAFAFDWGRIKQTYARHSSVFPDGTAGGNPNGYILQVEGKTIYLAGDTDVFAEMAYIGEDYAIDVAFLPIGDNFTMGHQDSVRAAKMLKPKLICPTHYDTFPYIKTDLQAWEALMAEAGFKTQCIEIGDHFILD